MTAPLTAEQIECALAERLAEIELVTPPWQRAQARVEARRMADTLRERLAQAAEQGRA